MSGVTLLSLVHAELVRIGFRSGDITMIRQLEDQVWDSRAVALAERS
jgi:hypothetical protein